MASHQQTEAIRAMANSQQNKCFVCGPGNPQGLQLHFETEAGVVFADFVPSEWHQGWEGIVHGGVVASVLDEAMAYCLFFRGIYGMTGRLDIRFRTAAHAQDRLRVEARVVRELRGIADIGARMLRDSEIVAEATGRFVLRGELPLAGLTV